MTEVDGGVAAHWQTEMEGLVKAGGAGEVKGVQRRRQAKTAGEGGNTEARNSMQGGGNSRKPGQDEPVKHLNW